MFQAPTDGFSAVVGHPPARNNNSRIQGYADYYLTARDEGEIISLLLPTSWLIRGNNALRAPSFRKIREDSGIVLVDDCVPVKPGGKSTVVLRKEGFNKPATLQSNGELVTETVDLQNFSPYAGRIDEVISKINEWREKNEVPSMFEKVSPVNPYGIFGSDLEKTKGSPISASPKDGTLPLYAKSRYGSRELLYIDESFPLLKGLENLSSFKVVWWRLGAYRSWREVTTLLPGSIHSDQFLSVNFDSEAEADGFLSYFKSSFYRFLYVTASATYDCTRITHRFVPDLTNVQNPLTGKVGWMSGWSDSSLKELLKDFLEDDDWGVIDAEVLRSDPGW